MSIILNLFQFSHSKELKKNIILYKILNILILFLPISLISGPFLSDLIVSFSSIILIILAIKEKKINYIFTPFTLIFFGFYIYLLSRSIFSENIQLSLESSLFFFRFIFFFMCIKLIFETNKNFIKSFLLMLIISFSFVFLFAIIQYFFSLNMFNSEYAGIRTSGIFGSELIMGSYVSRILPIILACVFYLKNKIIFSDYLIIILYVVSIFLIIISGERTALLNIIIITFLGLILSKNTRKILFYSFLIGSMISLITIFSNNKIKTRIIDLTLSETNLTNLKLEKILNDENGNLFIFAPQHMIFYKTAYKMYESNKIFGLGPKMYREACSYDKFYIDQACSTHPHNMYLQLLAETGLIGFIFISGLFIYVSYLLMKHFLSNFSRYPFLNDFKIYLLISIFITLWPLIPSGNIFHNWLLIIYFIPLGFLIAEKDFNE